MPPWAKRPFLRPSSTLPLQRSVQQVELPQQGTFESPDRLNRQCAEAKRSVNYPNPKRGEMLMNAVGIDVSKGKSMVAVMQPLGVVAASPFEGR